MLFCFDIAFPEFMWENNDNQLMMSVAVVAVVMNERTMAFWLVVDYLRTILFVYHFASDIFRVERFYLTKIFFQAFS